MRYKLYSNDCPNCKKAKSLLDRASIGYDLESDMAEIMKVARVNSLYSLPFMLDNDNKEFLNYDKIQQLVR